jgi:potassium/hydrogen antiporter
VQNRPVDELTQFAWAILLVSVGLTLAIFVRLGAGRIGIPTAGPLLVLAALASDLSDRLAGLITFVDVQRIATIALIPILFEGGLAIGLSRFRRAAGPIVALGVVGTFATAGLLAVSAHALLDVSWTVAWLLGAALAPTDPAVTFSVLAGKEVQGRSGTILEGESGVNDPVGIALMIGVVEYATSDDPALGPIVGDFVVEVVVGLVVGALAGIAIAAMVRRIAFPERSLFPVAMLLAAGVAYGVGTVAHGSGFLAVFVAGVVAGDVRHRAAREVREFNSAVSDLAELAVFVALGLTVDLGFITDEGLWWHGLVIAVLLGFVVRPLVVVPLLLPTSLGWGERLFVVWSGLKGAVPILLASLAVVAHTEYDQKLYGITFVVVLFSVLVQGSGVPAVARRLGVPMERHGYEP